MKIEKGYLFYIFCGGLIGLIVSLGIHFIPRWPLWCKPYVLQHTIVGKECRHLGSRTSFEVFPEYFVAYLEHDLSRVPVEYFFTDPTTLPPQRKLDSSEYYDYLPPKILDRTGPIVIQ